VKGPPLARLLHRLGLFSARRPFVVLVGWLVVLGIAVGGFLAFGGTLATSFDIPGTQTTKVTDQMQKKLDTTGGATGTVAFQTKGTGFTAEQKTEIGDLLTSIDGVKGVSSTIDPFTAQAQREQQQQQVATGRSQLTAGEQQIASGQQQIDAGTAQLNADRQQLNAAIAQAQAAGSYAAAQAQFAAQQQQLDAATANIETQQTTLDAAKTKLGADAARLAAAQKLIDAAKGITTVSGDGTTALGIVQFTDSIMAMPASVKEAVAAKLDAAHIPGVTVNYSSEIATSLNGLVGPGEITGLIIAAIVLGVMLRTLMSALLPIVTSLIGVGVGVAGAMAFSGVVQFSNVTPVLGLMLGLAVGIDYALFIVSRHRKQLLAGMEVRESIALANGTAGTAVVFAGMTVLVALLALNVSGVGFLGVMGTVGAGCVLAAVLIAVTLTPALLSLLGVRLVGKKVRARIGHPDHQPREVSPMGAGRAVIGVIVAVVGLLVIAVPALSMRLGLPDGSSQPVNSTAYRTYHIVEDKFGAGLNGPLLVTATLPEAVSADSLSAKEAAIADTLMKHSDVAAVAPAGVSKDRTFIAFEVVPKGGPSSASTEQLVHTLRASSPISVSSAKTSSANTDIALGVAGTASANIDVSTILANALPLYLAIVAGLSLIIMIIVFRSLLVPVIATGGYVLSLFAAFGGMTAVYQWGWLGPLFEVTDPAPVLAFAPIIVMGVLFGLAMDYQLFIASGMREAYAHGLPARHAVTSGLRQGRAVVTAAAIIMVSVFGGFMFSEVSMIRPLGFGLAFGVLFDAFVVRMLLVPGLMHLFGSAAWWLPKWLDRMLPDVDLEGASLERTHDLHGAPKPVVPAPEPAAYA
jgi:RND superfamily putative drug exporter